MDKSKGMKIINICKNYKKKGNTISVFKNINYEFKLGKMYAILGPSGSGKTTLINILGLLEQQTSGKIILDNIDVYELKRNERFNLRRDNFGYIFQNINLNDCLNAYDNIMLPMMVNKNLSREEKNTRIKMLLRKFDIEKRANHYPKELSGGEQQRVCIARALANKPKYILCDEPTSHLDEKNTLKVFELLKMISEEGYCVIVVSHNKKIYDYANICLEIKDGNIYEVK